MAASVYVPRPVTLDKDKSNFLTQELQRISQSSSSASQNITSAQADITTLKGDITTINGDITTINGDITTINTNLATLNSEVSAIESAWTAYTPTVTAQTGAITSYTVNAARYKQIGKVVHVFVNITLTNVGSASDVCIVDLPVTALTVNAAFFGSERAINGSALQGVFWNLTQFYFLYYNNTSIFASGNGTICILSGVYEAA